MPRRSSTAEKSPSTPSLNRRRVEPPAATGQLELGLIGGLPSLPIEADWQAQPRLWGHSFHPMASYLASFPAALAHAFIARYSRPGDVVLDPFSGRGTVPLQACAEDRIGVGNDLNPLAYLLTAAKVEPADPAESSTRLVALRLAWLAAQGTWTELATEAVREAVRRPGDPSVRVPAAGSLRGGLPGARLRGGRPSAGGPRADGPSAGGPRAGGPSADGHRADPPPIDRPGAGGLPTEAPGSEVAEPRAVDEASTAAGQGATPSADEVLPEEVALAFHPQTLGQLLFVRAVLDPGDRVDRFLLAALTGILHGKRRSYLSEVMPNTFSMARRYVRNFIRQTGYQPPERDVFDLLATKLARVHRDPLPATRGLALLGDARDVGERLPIELRRRALPERVRLVVGSPPYLRVVKYGYYNWLRAWLLGLDATAIDAALDDAHRREPYLAFLRDVLAGLRPLLSDDAIVVLVIGDVETDRGRAHPEGVGLAEQVWHDAAEPLGYELAGLVLDRVDGGRKMTKVWGDEAGRATKTDRILVLGATQLGRRRAIAGATIPVDWSWPPRLRLVAPARTPNRPMLAPGAPRRMSS